MTVPINTNLAQLFMRAFYWAEEGLQNTLKERGWAQITKAQSQVFISIGEGVTRPSEIAARMSVTRQAIHQTINELVSFGYVSLEPDPSDRRAKIVTYTDKGQEIGQNTVLGLSEIEAQLIARIGVDNVQALREALCQNWGEPYVPVEMRA
jgi:DNA-binding MarR family transcriptional regulator